MNTPDMETDLRTLFARVAEDAPEVHRTVLGDLSAQARGDHPWLRRTAPFAAAACVAAALVASFSLGGTDQQEVGSATPAAQTAEPPAVATNQAEALMGTWVPVQVEGQVVGTGYVEPPFVEFALNGSWVGSNGCTGLDGTFQLGAGPGEISIGLATMRGVACSHELWQPPNLTTHFRVTGETLELFDKADRLLATYRRHTPFVHRE